MERERVRKRMLKILDIAPDLKEIILSKAPLEEKRVRVKDFLNKLLIRSYDEDPAIPPLEWILARDAIRALRTILSPRSEALADHSFLGYITQLVQTGGGRGVRRPRPDFYAEVEALLKGMMGKTGIYDDKVPAFLKYEGRKAARMRSAELSRMAKKAHRFKDRYPSGLDEEIIRKRSENKARILRYFRATEMEWEDWKWHVKNVIRDEKRLNALIQLSSEDYEAVKLARMSGIPFGITPYYVSLMDYETGMERDRAVRAQVIPSLHYVKTLRELRDKAAYSMDFMLERDTSPIDGITRRYPMIVILKPVLTCPQICVYCQRNWEIEDVDSSQALLVKSNLEEVLRWLEDRPEINEVLITGGDPFLLPDTRIEDLLSRLSGMGHLERIRIGTRTPVTLPQRVTEPLVRAVNSFHIPGKREILLVTHVEHPYEITPQMTEAVQKFRRYGMGVYNQMVYTFFNSRKFEAAALRHKLRLAGVTPYYTFNTKGKEETDEYRVPIARLLQEQNEEARLLPGAVRTDEVVFNVPRLGKNYLRAAQHRDVISILPDGRRVYEFHPWEKNLSLVDTYVYTDVSIYGYLKRLKAVGEDLNEYKTIWYYY
ncbi:MAG: KamA family radical SAM protein [Deltaproteobacteria bacterium]|nr:KamA family radical SAM protein [Deltaproteobacteria bacterium]MBW2137941.1 KamA family radical SAM protein [Deltaproteobacteria bacterium]